MKAPSAEQAAHRARDVLGSAIGTPLCNTNHKAVVPWLAFKALQKKKKQKKQDLEVPVIHSSFSILSDQAIQQHCVSAYFFIKCIASDLEICNRSSDAYKSLRGSPLGSLHYSWWPQTHAPGPALFSRAEDGNLPLLPHPET